MDLQVKFSAISYGIESTAYEDRNLNSQVKRNLNSQVKRSAYEIIGLDRTFSEKPFGYLNEEGIRRTRFTIVDHCMQCNYVAKLYGVLRITS
ncbi:hypothetical protein C0J52_07892 [Blattella germanica]|nr:hypothetical protein C0J52_07892 [Blattella germanica]